MKLLTNIKTQNEEEERLTHDDELQAQHDYEDSMKSLVEAEDALRATLSRLNKDIDGTKVTLLQKHNDQTNTERNIIALERYIEKMKPGCDLILNSFDSRTKGRDNEKAALVGAKDKLSKTSAFKRAQEAE